VPWRCLSDVLMMGGRHLREQEVVSGRTEGFPGIRQSFGEH
jgi:hypothetical protein